MFKFLFTISIFFSNAATVLLEQSSTLSNIFSVGPKEPEKVERFKFFSLPWSPCYVNYFNVKLLKAALSQGNAHCYFGSFYSLKYYLTEIYPTDSNKRAFDAFYNIVYYYTGKDELAGGAT